MTKQELADERLEAARRTVRSLRERAIDGGMPFVLTSGAKRSTLR